MLLSSLAASAYTAGDTTTQRPQAAFFFCKIPRPILPCPTLADHRQRLFGKEEHEATDFHQRKEKLGTGLTIAGGLGMLVGAFVVYATNRASANPSVSDPQHDANLYAFFGGMSLVPASFALSVTGLAIYGVHRRKRKRQEAD